MKKSERRRQIPKELEELERDKDYYVKPSWVKYIPKQTT